MRALTRVCINRAGGLSLGARHAISSEPGGGEGGQTNNNNKEQNSKQCMDTLYLVPHYLSKLTRRVVDDDQMMANFHHQTAYRYVQSAGRGREHHSSPLRSRLAEILDDTSFIAARFLGR